MQARIARVWQFFRTLEKGARFSLAALTILRSLQIILFITHLAACLFYFLSDALNFGATSEDGSLRFVEPDGPFTWIKLDKAQVMSLSVFERCAVHSPPQRLPLHRFNLGRQIGNGLLRASSTRRKFYRFRAVASGALHPVVVCAPVQCRMAQSHASFVLCRRLLLSHAGF